MTDRTPAKFTINGTPSEPRGFAGSHSQTLTFALEVPPNPDVFRVVFSVFDPAVEGSPVASLDAPLLTLSPSTGVPVTVDGSVTTTLPSSGSASWLVRCVINDGFDRATGKIVPEWTFTRLVAILSNAGLQKLVPAETTEFNPRGWSDVIDQIIDALDSVSGGGAVGDATTSTKGIVRLGNDLGGTANNPQLVKLNALGPGVVIVNPDHTLSVLSGASAMVPLLFASRTNLAAFDTATLPAARRGWPATTGSDPTQPLERWVLVPDDTANPATDPTRVAAKTGGGATGNWVLETN